LRDDKERGTVETLRAMYRDSITAKFYQGGGGWSGGRKKKKFVSTVTRIRDGFTAHSERCLVAAAGEGVG